MYSICLDVVCILLTTEALQIKTENILMFSWETKENSKKPLYNSVHYHDGYLYQHVYYMCRSKICSIFIYKCKIEQLLLFIPRPSILLWENEHNKMHFYLDISCFVLCQRMTHGLCSKVDPFECESLQLWFINPLGRHVLDSNLTPPTKKRNKSISFIRNYRKLKLAPLSG